MANTYLEIINRVYHHLATDTDSTTYDLNTVVKPKINSVIKSVCKGRYKSLLDKRIIKAGDLKFIKGKAFYDVVIPRPLQAQVLTTDTAIELVATGYLPSGYVYISGDVIQYASNSGNFLLGCSGILTNHKMGDIVEQIHPVPADADRSFVLYEIDRYGREQEVTYHNAIYGMGITPNYAHGIGSTIWTTVNDNNGNTYILIRSPHGPNQKYKLGYYRKAVDLVNDADLCIIPDDTGVEIIAPIVAGELLYTTEEDQQGEKLLNISYDQLEMFYADQVQFNKQYRRKVIVGNNQSYLYPDIIT